VGVPAPRRIHSPPKRWTGRRLFFICSDMSRASRNPCPDWAQSIGALIAAGATCRVQCGTCFGTKGLDLERIAAARGRDFCLWNKRSRCRLSPGCRGTARFYVVQHAGALPMWDF
jgi:hypothetical protein